MRYSRSRIMYQSGFFKAQSSLSRYNDSWLFLIMKISSELILMLLIMTSL